LLAIGGPIRSEKKSGRWVSITVGKPSMIMLVTVARPAGGEGKIRLRPVQAIQTWKKS